MGVLPITTRKANRQRLHVSTYTTQRSVADALRLKFFFFTATTTTGSTPEVLYTPLVDKTER